MSRFLACVALLCMPALSGCERQQPAAPASTAPAATQPSASPRLPALFVGTLPCADCAGIRHELDLRADGVFFLRTTYLGGPTEAGGDDIGQWNLTDGNVLILHGSRAAPLQFSVRDDRVLRQLDLEGRAIDSTLNYDLTRQERYTPLAPRLQMRGLYQRTADTELFEECLTGLKLAVAPDADHAALDAAYRKLHQQPQQQVLAELEGSILQRPGTAGAPRDTLIVERMLDFAPNEGCGARGVTHDLASTRWVLVRLGETIVPFVADQREPFIALESAQQRVAGHGGCNRIVGSYTLNGAELRFTQLTLTRMTCPRIQTENAFAQALNATTRWNITGNRLELFDANGAMVARFEARNL